MVGSSARKGERSFISAYDIISGDCILRDSVFGLNEGTSVVQWLNPNKLNQIFVGSSFGNIKVLYSPEKTNSDIGVLKALQKEAR